MKNFLAIGILIFPSFALGQDNSVINFRALVNSETAFSVQAGAAAACGFRSKRRTESVLVFTITGVENASRNLWPGNNKDSLSGLGNSNLTRPKNRWEMDFALEREPTHQTAQPSQVPMTLRQSMACCQLHTSFLI